MDRIAALAPEFTFAGFTFPRYLARMPKRFKTLAERKAYPCGEYYHAPRAENAGQSAFYLESDGMPGLRWEWCDVISSSIGHSGWWCDGEGIGETIRGIVFRLPSARGFIIGASMGEKMIGWIDGSRVFDDEMDAAHAADRKAEQMAEREREYQAQQDDELNSIPDED